MSHRLSFSWRVGFLLGAVLLLAAGCSLSLDKCRLPWAKCSVPAPVATTTPVTATSTEAGGQNKIKRFADKEALVAFLNNLSAGDNLGGTAMMRGLGMPTAAALGFNEAASDGAGQAATKAAAPAGQADYSATNVQVAGVDEADIVKTDGEYIYAVNRQEILIIKADSAAEAKIVGRIVKNDAEQPQELYISGNKLVVFGQTYGQHLSPVAGSSTTPDCNPGPDCEAFFRKTTELVDRSFAYARVYDVADKAKPVLERDLALEGGYLNSRLIGDFVYLITNEYSYEAGPEPLPLLMRQGKPVAPGELPPVYYFDLPYRSAVFTTITAFNIKDPAQTEKNEVYLLDGEQNLFVSSDNIYITYTKRLDENQLWMEITKEVMLPKLAATDQARIAKIEAADAEVLSAQEKLGKVFAILSRHLGALNPQEQAAIESEIKARGKQKYADISKELEKTVIHKIAIKQDKLEYKGSGEVNGSVLNQFAMDEQDGYFRIATTKNQSWSRFGEEQGEESYNNLFVLDGDLKTVGTLENLAKGERIYSVRFMGKRAYLVTFKQTDPLFVIDLATPTAPKVLGELKVPGFSNYLHPYDENTLIGFGKETSDNGFGGVIAGGLKLSLFDVSQVDKPVELDHYAMGDRGSDSVALGNHKAFLFSKDKNLLVVPVSLYESAKKDEWGKFVFGGAAIFSIESNKFVLRGRIDHSDGGRPGENYHLDGYSYYDNNVLRSLYIKDVLYTLSGRYLKANQLSDLAPIKSLGLAGKEPAAASGSGGNFRAGQAEAAESAKPAAGAASRSIIELKRP